MRTTITTMIRSIAGWEEGNVMMIWFAFAFAWDLDLDLAFYIHSGGIWICIAL